MINSMISIVKSDALQLKNDAIYMYKKVEGFLNPEKGNSSTEEINKKIGMIAVRVLATLAMCFYVREIARLAPSLFRAPLSTTLTSTALKGIAFCTGILFSQMVFDKSKEYRFFWQ